MVSTIIQKEKERQEFLIGCFERSDALGKGIFHGIHRVHQQSLINLKEHMEHVLANTSGIWGLDGNFQKSIDYQYNKFIESLEEDIEELNKMIERYK